MTTGVDEPFGRIRARCDEALVSVPDIMPSLLGLMGFAADIPAGVEGTNLELYAACPMTGGYAGPRKARATMSSP